MGTGMITFELPTPLYDKLQSLAADEQVEPVEIIARLVERAYQHRAWLADLTALREQIRRDGGLQVGVTRDEVVEQLHQTRREIFSFKHL